MVIKGMNGESYNVGGSGQSALNTVLGSLGTASFLGLNANNLLGGLGWGNNPNRPVEVITSEDKPISRYEAKMMQELAAKDGKIALLEANTYTDQKLSDVYERLTNKIDANKASQDALNLQQAVYNGTNTAAIECMKGQIAQLASLSELVVPQRRVCDTGCGCGC